MYPPLANWRHSCLKAVLRCLVASFFFLGTWTAAHADEKAKQGPESLDLSRLENIDAAVEQSIKNGDMPGAVVLVIHKGKIVYQKAFGNRALKPTMEPMTLDTVFDLASLTKPVATAVSIMILAEQGKLALDDRVGRHWPEFAAHHKEAITIKQLLLHTSGLLADNPEADYRDGKDKALARIAALKPDHKPGVRFRYSDVNYIVLGELVERISKRSLDQFAADEIFRPLGMNDTGFKPDEAHRRRAAPCDSRNGVIIRGEVHDPRSHLLGGVAGHAGLFSTAGDLVRFVQMILNGGVLDGRRILAPLSVSLMTTPHEVSLASSLGLRALGWDIDTPFSANRGSLFSADTGFGHTGFTGTSLWIDPPSQTAVIFLSNRLHPDGKGNVNRIRGQVATIVASALSSARNAKPGPTIRQPREPGAVLNGIDVLERDKFAPLKGKKVGLVTNHTGINRQGRSTIDILIHAEGVKLVALFSPEHGIRGQADEKVADGKDEATGLPVYSLYGERTKPSAKCLEGIDTLVFDIQDAGCRFYTYISTLGLVLEAAAQNKIKLVVLDRPNPLGGQIVEGPVLDEGRESFTAYYRLPIRHGLTVCELAKVYNHEKKRGCDLEIIKMEGWRRGATFDQTGLRWINPSPNLRTLTEALLYPGVGLLEMTNLSVGRGTDRPFEWIGAPWIDGEHLAAEINKAGIPGLRCLPMKATPASSRYKDKECGGVNFIVDDWHRFRPLDLGLVLATSLIRLYPDEWQVDAMDKLLGHKATLVAIKQGVARQAIKKSWTPEIQKFLKDREKCLLYPD